MKKFALPLLSSLLFAQSAFAMPCDTGYTCKSATGRYQLELQHCRYDNHLGNLVSFSVGGAPIHGARLGAAWDGDQFLAFEIALADRGSTQRLLSVEVNRKTGLGVIRDKTRNYNPSPWNTTHSEAIKCVDQG